MNYLLLAKNLNLFPKLNYLGSMLEKKRHLSFFIRFHSLFASKF